jgi:hypothetical protein
MTGVFELAEQRGRKGYFGKVLVEVEPDDDLKGFEITFDEKHARNQEWRDAAKFGIEYAYTNIPKKQFLSKGHRIRVQSIQGHSVDTNSLIVAYAVVCALLRAFGRSESELVSFDPESGKIVFSK